MEVGQTAGSARHQPDPIRAFHIGQHTAGGQCPGEVGEWALGGCAKCRPLRKEWQQYAAGGKEWGECAAGGEKWGKEAREGG